MSQQEYTPEAHSAAATPPPARTSLNYTGQRKDATGLLYYHARFYDPLLGRFVSPDTVVPGSFTKKGYAMDDEYDDSYTTCKETSASFRIIHPDLDPDRISQQMNLMPSWAWRRGQLREKSAVPLRVGIWGLDTEAVIASRDVRRHIDWLLDQIEPKAQILTQFRTLGYKMDIFCLWCRLGGTGGPLLSPKQTARLGAIDLPIGFEFWDDDDDDDKR